ncbi:MAG: cobyric acid synthase [Oscillospiraceae bacterium]
MAKAIMIQGTCSNAGKSFVTAGLCRAFSNAGYKTAPFKSQNMSRNYYKLDNGKIISSAQAVQCMAARCEKSVLSNPIVLVPNSDVGSNVVVMGESVGNMNAKEYFVFKNSLRDTIQKAFSDLSEKNDIIVIEGGGSPAEINLREGDIVNMGMAKMANAPVILVGDIDRGGVFASIYGTINLLEKDEQDLIKGFVINKFRGDIDILLPGVKTIEDLTKKSCFGVVPYADVYMEAEDSLCENNDSEKPSAEFIDAEFDKIARVIENSLNMKKIYAMLNI